MSDSEQLPPEPDFAGDIQLRSPRYWHITAPYKILLLLIVAIVLAGHANAQAVRFDSVADTTSSSCASGKICPLNVLPGTQVNFCSGANAGVVNTSGKTVTWVSGQVFSTLWTGQISINGTSQQIASVASTTSLTTVASLGTLTGVVYSSLSACLASPATTYTDFTAGTPCATTAQLTPQTGGACLSTANNQGEFGGWFTPGQYSYYLRVPSSAGGGTYGPYPINIGASAGCPTNAACDANYTTLALGCTAAGAGTLYVTKAWNGLTTQTLSCNMVLFGNARIQPASGQTVTLAGTFDMPNFPVFDLSAGGTIVMSGAGQPQICKPQAVVGTDLGLQMNRCITMLPNGGTVDSRLTAAVLTTTPVLPSGITLLLGAGLYSSSNNPVIKSTGGTNTIEGNALTTTEIRYTGAGAGDILRCGTSAVTTAIGCAYLTLRNLMFNPMEGSVATVDIHLYNPVYIDFSNLRILHSGCTGGLTDPSPHQGTCGTGSATNGQNIGIKFDTTGFGTVPEMGQYRDSQMLFAAGRGTDASNAAGTTRDYWFNGSAVAGGYLAHIKLSGTSDTESSAIPFECDHCSDVMVDGTNFFSGVTPVVISNSSYVTFLNVRISGAVTNNFTVDAGSSDVFLWTQIVNSGTCSYTNAGSRTVIWNPGSCAGFYDFGPSKVGTGNLVATGTLHVTGASTLDGIVSGAGFTAGGNAMSSPGFLNSSVGNGSLAALVSVYPCSSGLLSFVGYVTDLTVPATGANINSVAVGGSVNKGHVVCNGGSYLVMGP